MSVIKKNPVVRVFFLQHARTLDHRVQHTAYCFFFLLDKNKTNCSLKNLAAERLAVDWTGGATSVRLPTPVSLETTDSSGCAASTVCLLRLLLLLLPPLLFHPHAETSSATTPSSSSQPPTAGKLLERFPLTTSSHHQPLLLLSLLLSYSGLITVLPPQHAHIFSLIWNFFFFLSRSRSFCNLPRRCLLLIKWVKISKQ